MPWKRNGGGGGGADAPLMLAEDFIVTNSTTLASVPGLSVPVDANSTYAVKAVIVTASHSTPASRYMFVAPGDAVGRLASRSVELAFNALTTESGVGSGGMEEKAYRGNLVTTSAGTVEIQFAQLSPDANESVLAVGTYLHLVKVA